MLKFAHKSWLQVVIPWYSTPFWYFSNFQTTNLKYVIMAMAKKMFFYLLVFLSCIKPYSLPSFIHPCFSPLMPYNLDLLSMWGAHFSHETAGLRGLGMMEIPGSCFFWLAEFWWKNKVNTLWVGWRSIKRLGDWSCSCMAQRVWFTDGLFFGYQPILVRCWKDVCSFYIPFSIVMTPPWHILTWCLFGGE